MKILSENVDVEYPHEIFQIGKVFHGYKEQEHLCVVISPGNLTKIKQILEHFSKMLGIEIKIKEVIEVPGHFIEGRSVEILFENDKIGLLGEMHPKILTNFRLKMPVALFEISLDKILDKLI